MNNFQTFKFSYFDGFTGQQKTYICDFSAIVNGVYHHFEVKPLRKQVPTDKYLYAKNCINNWRWITKEEIDKSYSLFKNGLFKDRIKIINIQSSKKKNLYYYTEDPTPPKLDQKFQFIRTIKYGIYYKHKFKNTTYRRPRKTKHTSYRTGDTNKPIMLILDKILENIKNDKSLSEISKSNNCSGRTITKFLHENSIYVKWRTSKRYSEIYKASKKMWPTENLPLKTISNSYWDNYDWLCKHYVDKQLSARKIGELVGRSYKAILKRLHRYGIPTRSNAPKNKNYQNHKQQNNTRN